MLLHHGFPPAHRIKALLHEQDDDFVISKIRWYVSLSIRFLIGFCTGIVTFLLVVKSERVRDGTLLLLYFAGEKAMGETSWKRSSHLLIRTSFSFSLAFAQLFRSLVEPMLLAV